LLFRIWRLRVLVTALTLCLHPPFAKDAKDGAPGSPPFLPAAENMQFRAGVDSNPVFVEARDVGETLDFTVLASLSASDRVVYDRCATFHHSAAFKLVFQVFIDLCGSNRRDEISLNL
jgi:hypothetical protein